MHALRQDVRYGVRVLRKNPAFTLVAALTLSLGIGANTAIFSVVNGVLLRPLPYTNPYELISIDRSQSAPDLEDFQRQGHAIAQLGGYADWSFDLLGKAEPEQVKGALVSVNLFPALGVKPLLGRTLGADDDRLGGAPMVLVSHRFWTQRMGADPEVIGKSLNLTGKSYTVIGVMPAGFILPRGEPELFVPLKIGYPEAANQRGVHFNFAIGRLAPHTSIQQAQAEITAISKRLAEIYPEENRGRQYTIVGLHDRVVRNVRATLLLLLGAVGFVLLIASSNFANLLLARASARRAELQTRLALGASASRLVRQLLTESLLLGLLGGTGGIGLAFVALQALLAAKPKQLPTLATLNIDTTVLVFALAISSLTGLLFGLFPAADIVREAKRAGVQQGIAEARHSRSTLFRQVLIASEVALCVTLLCGSGLLIRSLVRLQDVSPGFETESILTAQLWLRENHYHDVAAQDRILRNIVEGLEHAPGVQSAALVTEPPLSGQHLSHNFIIAGRPPIPVGSEPDVDTNLVSPSYFETLKIPILKGRVFTPEDRAGAPPVAIINLSMAKQFWGSEDPIGARVAYARSSQRTWMNVVGVVADVRASGLDQPDEPTIYTPIFQKQEEWRRWATIGIRSSGIPPLELAPLLKKQVWRLDDQLPLVQIQPLSYFLEESLAERRFNTFLLGVLASVSLALAMVGIYGVISYTVAQRTREFGIRMALGAVTSDLLGIVLIAALKLIVAGAATGLVAALLLTRVLSGMLFGISSRDPLTFLSITLLLLTVALAAALVPALRASSVDPVVALRHE